jgi:hypothetical protein
MWIALFWFVVAVVAAIVADNKGRSGVGWFFACLLLPFVILILLALPTIEAPQPSDPIKTCPQCAETVKAEAKICRFCRFEFPLDTLPATHGNGSQESAPASDDDFHHATRAADGPKKPTDAENPIRPPNAENRLLIISLAVGAALVGVVVGLFLFSSPSGPSSANALNSGKEQMRADCAAATDRITRQLNEVGSRSDELSPLIHQRPRDEFCQDVQEPMELAARTIADFKTIRARCESFDPRGFSVAQSSVDQFQSAYEQTKGQLGNYCVGVQ